ncbi:MAG TPA: DsrE/DsrF/DrsH-like family protein [Marmoricola sp.]|nr:DsrE/DsrF/DrsH-like family protein [Marmoricola sp.]HNI71419.1 DsrE/DsrF/DrsH-like family protein [Marmoricola sp.]HNJ78159.1 DsrE/DsrF/DrsH-like family protein [Marmoricola sp.]HNO39606.1 DsrE/DsrF/DrsH-like family protein [Marmoricola sp.]
MRQIPEGFIIPDFGKAPGAPSNQSAGSGEGTTYDGPRKMALICSKGNLDMAYPGLILGNAAAGEGIETHIFFTFWGLDIVNKKTNDKLQFTMIGNTAMHMPDLGYVKPGLEHWSMPQFMGRLPGMTKASTKMMKKQMEDLEIPTVPEFLDLLQASGVHMYACKLSFDMMKMLEADLHPAVEGVISAGDFIEISTGAQTLFI